MNDTGAFKKGFFMGLATGAVAAAVLYKKRRTIRAELWKLRARAEVHQRLRDLKRVTKSNYEQTVDDVLARYQGMKHISAEELDAFSDDLKRGFSRVRDRFEQMSRRSDDEGEEE